MWDKSVSGLCLFAFVRSCQSFQLCGAEEPVQIAEQLLCSCQNWSLMLLQRGRVCRRRGQRSWVHHPTGCFKCVCALEVTGGSTLMWHTLVGAFLLILDSVGRYAKNGKQKKKKMVVCLSSLFSVTALFLDEIIFIFLTLLPYFGKGR